MSWDNEDLQNLIANAQRAEMIRQKDKELEELKKLNSQRGSVHSQTENTRPKERELKCPACAEYIKAEAKICRYCRSEVGESFAAILDEEKKRAAENLRKLKQSREKAEKEEKARLDYLAKANEVKEFQRKAAAEARKGERAATRAKFARWFKSKSVLSTFASITVIAITAGITLAVLQTQKDESASRNKNQTCRALLGVFSELAKPIPSKSKLNSSTSSLSKSLESWKKENGSENALYGNLLSFSTLLKEQSQRDLSQLSRKLTFFKTTETSKLITGCHFQDQFILSSSAEFTGGTNIESYCYKGADYLKAEFQIKNSSGSWLSIGSRDFGWPMGSTCSGYLAKIENYDLGLIDTGNFSGQNFRTKIFRTNELGTTKGNLVQIWCGRDVLSNRKILRIDVECK